MDDRGDERTEGKNRRRVRSRAINDKVQLEMQDVKENLSKVAEAITNISEDNNTRDQRLEELIKGFSTG